MTKKRIVVGLDIGTTKICTIIGQVQDNHVEVIGVGTSPSFGLRRGMVVDIDTTVRSIEQSVSKAEKMAGIRIGSAYVGIAGGHIASLNSHGVVAVTSENREVESEDVDRVLEAARVIAIPPEREILHVLPRDYAVDGCSGIKDPVGMSGMRLEVEAHIVTGMVTAIQNIVKCVHRAGLEVEDVVLEPIASAEAVLTKAEKDLGVVLVDIGGGTSDIVIFEDGSIRHSSVIPIGGDNLTKDIAICLRTDMEMAERIKREYGYAFFNGINNESSGFFEITGLTGKETKRVTYRELSEIIQPRIQEILSLVNREIINSGNKCFIPAGIVLTGGTSLTKRLPELAGSYLDLPIRVGYPDGVGGLIDVVHNPVYATGVGLVLYGIKNHSIEPVTSDEDTFIYDILSRIKGWFKSLF